MELTTSHLFALLAFFAVHVGTAIWWGARLSGKSIEHERRIGDLETNLADLVRALVIEQKHALERRGEFGKLELRIETIEREVESLRNDQGVGGAQAG